jgi:hypothetical protein
MSTKKLYAKVALLTPGSSALTSLSHLGSVGTRQQFAHLGICFSATIQQCLQHPIAVLFSSSGDGNDRRNWRFQRNKNRLWVRHSTDFIWRKRHAFSGSDRGKECRERLDVMSKARSKSCVLTGGADRGVASGKFFLGEPDEVFFFEFGQCDAFAQSEQMIVRQHGLKRDSRQHSHCEFAFDFGAGISNQREINPSFAQCFQLFGGGHLAQGHFNFWVVFRESAEPRRQNARQHRSNVTDGQSFFGSRGERFHLFDRISAPTKQVSRVRKESFSRRCELETGFLAEKQWDTQLLFQVAQLAAHRRLRNAQACRSTAHVQFFRDGHEVAQVPEFHSRTGITERHSRPKNKALGEE